MKDRTYSEGFLIDGGPFLRRHLVKNCLSIEPSSHDVIVRAIAECLAGEGYRCIDKRSVGDSDTRDDASSKSTNGDHYHEKI